MTSKRRVKCLWREDADGNWDTSCGETWCFIDGGPKENSCRFCPYCGGSLVAQKSRDEVLEGE